MSNITLLTKPSLDFVTTLSSGNKSKSKEASMALGRVLAYKLDIPSAPIEDLQMYINQAYIGSLEALVFNINEITILDKEQIRIYFNKFFNARYNICHGNDILLSTNPEMALADFFKLSSSLSNDDIKFISDNCITLMSYVNKFKHVVNDLEQVKNGSQ